MSAKTIIIYATLCMLVIAVSSVVAQQALLIITPQEFVDELQPLIRFKNASARPTYLLTLNEIYTQFNDPLWDNPERIKRCIAYYESNYSVDHVLLVGDVDKMPVRWRWWNRWMPDDPFFEGDWEAKSPGLYYQSDENPSAPHIPYCSWVDIGNYNEYTIEVYCQPISGDAATHQIRIYYADAEKLNSGYRIEMRPTTMELWACGDFKVSNYAFDFGTWHHLKIEVGTANVQVWIDGVFQDSIAWNNVDPVNLGKIGLGTYRCKAAFDNLYIWTGNNIPLLFEDFNDYVADGFHTSITMTERNWGVNDLYYADLYKTATGPPPVFDDWDRDNNQLYGEIQWNPDPIGCQPNCKNLNQDHIDFLPDVRVGRIPASTSDELSRYVNKVIAYELKTTRTDSWFKRAVLYEGSIGYGGLNDNIETYLSQQPTPGFTVDNRRWSSTFEPLTDTQRGALVVSDFNQGAGFINYLGGHGNVNEWSCLHFRDQEVMNDLDHTGKWPVVFAAACLTSKFAPIPPEEGYTDINGFDHNGSSVDCEALPVSPETVAPMELQTNHDVDCFGENLIFHAGVPTGSTSGAIAYLGERTAGRHWGDYLSEYFFLAYSEDITVGDMWKKMIEDYHQNPDPDNPSITLADTVSWVYGPEKWDEGHMVDEPLKFFLFGDPSLVTGGAFNQFRSGTMWDYDLLVNGPWFSFQRYRVSGDVTVPAGSTLTVLPGASVLVEDGNKIMGSGSGASEGFYIDATIQNPVYLLIEPPTLQVNDPVRGIKVTGKTRARNSGGIKLF